MQYIQFHYGITFFMTQAFLVYKGKKTHASCVPYAIVVSSQGFAARLT